MNIFIDDLREAPEKYDQAFTTAENFLEWYALNNQPKFDLISLDHDLGEYNMNGYDLVKFLVDFNVSFHNIQFHTDNTEGFKNMYYYVKDASNKGRLPALQHLEKRKVICIDGVETFASYTIV
ncbi:hypothetical protein LL50_05255 [Listeria monocytogenes]|nr:hypothetical protein [Listeria monocytogenes]EAD0383136.1 hypothetical protein [Listeria monocytogenes]EAF2023479.1 hypothetical protein [Listeria monocytogenes]